MGASASPWPCCSAKGCFYLLPSSPPFTASPEATAEIPKAAVNAGPAFIFSMHLAGTDGNILTAEAGGAGAREDEPPAAGVQMNAQGKEG